jgi:hypothetical protein
MVNLHGMVCVGMGGYRVAALTIDMCRQSVSLRVMSTKGVFGGGGF